MAQVRRGAFLAVAILAIVVAGGCSSSSKTTTNSSSSSAAGGVTVPASGSGYTVNVTVSDTKGTDAAETLVPSPTSTVAGDVTFTVKNTGTIDHEVVVLKTDTAFDQLPVATTGEEADKVDESSSQGETGDPALKPGETRSFTIKGLAAGNYVLVCNIAKHYGLGMRAAFKVS